MPGEVSFRRTFLNEREPEDDLVIRGESKLEREIDHAKNTLNRDSGVNIVKPGFVDRITIGSHGVVPNPEMVEVFNNDNS